MDRLDEAGRGRSAGAADRSGLAPPIRRHGADAPVPVAAPRRLALGRRSERQCGVEVTRGGHDLSGGQHGQGRDAKVDTDDPAAGARGRCRVRQLHGEGDVPPPALSGQGRRADARDPGIHLAGEGGDIANCVESLLGAFRHDFRRRSVGATAPPSAQCGASS